MWVGPLGELLPQASCVCAHNFTDFAGGERISKVIHIDLKKRPIPSIWTRSFLRCFRSHSLLWPARPAVPLPTKSQKSHLWYLSLFAVCFELSELANRSWYLPQLSAKLVTERHQQDDPAAIFYLLLDLTIHVSYITSHASKKYERSLVNWFSVSPRQSTGIKMAATAGMNARGWPRNRAPSNAGKYMTGQQGTQIDRTVRL